MGIGGAVSWMSMIVAITAFPVVSAAVGQAVPFFVMAVISLLSSIFVVLFLAETKGLPLDQISSMEVVNVRKNVKEFGLLLGWWLCSEDEFATLQRRIYIGVIIMCINIILQLARTVYL